MDSLQLATGIPVPVPEIGITLLQPKIAEIAILGEQEYFTALNVFSMNKAKLKQSEAPFSDFQMFQFNLSQEIEGIKSIKILIGNFLQLFFKEKVIVMPTCIMLNSEDKVISIEPEQFPLIQERISEIGGISLFGNIEKEEFNTQSAKAKLLAEKIKKARARVAALQPKKKEKGFLSNYFMSLLLVSANSIEDLKNLTILQLIEVMHLYLKKEAYELDIQSRLAGAKNEKKLIHWMMAPDEESSGNRTMMEDLQV